MLITVSRRPLGACAAALFAAGFMLASAAVDPAVASRRVRTHLTFLADDLLEGRGTGTRGYALAANYVAAQYSRLGIEPGAEGGRYEQPMKLLEAANNLEAGRLVVRQGDKEDALTAINDMLAVAAPGQTSAEVTAPAVFVGYGVQAPELNYDDFAGVDLKGKIAVVLFGAPKRFPSEPRAHYSNSDQKRALLVRQGAVGMVMILTPRDAARWPWAIFIAQSRFPSMRLLEPSGAMVDGFPELRATAVVNPAAAGRLFAAAPRTVENAFAAGERGEPQAFPLNVTLTLAGAATVRPIESANVLGWLPGSDPKLAGEPVVLTAHLDHIGIGAAVNGDTIYNGAMDNAMGVSLVLAVAEELAAGPRLRRPVLFAAVTGEEKGLLGARHLARHPPQRVQRFAANVNMDMPLFIAPVRDVVAFGAEHSTLGAVVGAVAGRHGYTLTPDPMPEEIYFVRSDQYSFVREGVPAIYLDTGPHSIDPGVDLPALTGKFLKERYHKPSDDLAQPIDWPSAGAYVALMTDITREIADDPKAPAWLPGDFFGNLYGKH